MRTLPMFSAFLFGVPAIAQQDGVALDWLGTTARTTIAVGDVDADGIEDVVASVRGQLSWWRGLAGAPARRFAAESRAIGSVGCGCENNGHPTLVDFDGDGDFDVVTADVPSGRDATPRVVWFANDGNGAFAAMQVVTAAGGGELVVRDSLDTVRVIDFDGDGRRDIVVASRALSVHRGGDDGFAKDGARTPMNLRSPVWCDHDRDGKTDVVAIVDSRVVLFARGPEGLVEVKTLAKVNGDIGHAWVDVVDWDGDGSTDVVLSETVVEQPVAVALGADEKSEVAAADLDLAKLASERKKLNETRPPADDAGMRERVRRRNDLERRIAAAREVRDSLTSRSHPRAEHRASVRVVLVN